MNPSTEESGPSKRKTLKSRKKVPLEARLAGIGVKLNDFFFICSGAISEAFNFIEKKCNDKGKERSDCLAVLALAHKFLLQNSEMLKVRCRLDKDGAYAMHVIDDDDKDLQTSQVVSQVKASPKMTSPKMTSPKMTSPKMTDLNLNLSDFPLSPKHNAVGKKIHKTFNKYPKINDTSMNTIKKKKIYRRGRGGRNVKLTDGERRKTRLCSSIENTRTRSSTLELSNKLGSDTGKFRCSILSNTLPDKLPSNKRKSSQTPDKLNKTVPVPVPEKKRKLYSASSWLEDLTQNYDFQT